jgi:hypothetical protein
MTSAPTDNQKWHLADISEKRYLCQLVQGNNNIK